MAKAKKSSSFSVRYGGKSGKRISLKYSSDMLVTRTDDRTRSAATVVRHENQLSLNECQRVAAFHDAGVEVFRLSDGGRPTARRDALRQTLKKDSSLSFAGRVLVDRLGSDPVIYTENIFVQFDAGVRESRVKKLLRENNLTVKRKLDYAVNAWFVQPADGAGDRVFKIAEDLLRNEHVLLCHPELVRQSESKAAHSEQWHLFKTTLQNGNLVDAHCRAVEAWTTTKGEGVVIAVIDDGVDIDHEEFSGAAKIVSPRDATLGTDNPRPKHALDSHGTGCAGVAAGNGNHKASGVAPAARLMPIRLMSGLGSQAEADAFVWAADHGADVISCSWGPRDGRWFDPNDPLHDRVVPMPDSTKLAVAHAVENGRNGKGCVICWAAGNGNESVDNDGYASHPDVIAVAACSDRNKKSVYSDFGDAIWCAFPSSNFGPPPPKSPGIWTTDLQGVSGANSGNSADPSGDYRDDFGGTSSSCPGAAGVAALVLSRNPDLNHAQVKELLKHSCDRIDTAGGNYDADGHSKLYGYGRLNARKAVDLAAPASADRRVAATAFQDVAIEDMETSSSLLHVGETSPIKNIRVTVDIEHSYIGDLTVRIVAPPGTGVSPITLHDRTGGTTNNLKKTYDQLSTPALANLVGVSPAGKWKITVKDSAHQDQGRIISFGLDIEF